MQITSALTLEEFLKLPETKPASEYIDGVVFQKPRQLGWREAKKPSKSIINFLASAG